MGEKIAFAPWNYINILCSNHKKELVLGLSGSKPIYRCEEQGCPLCFSAEVHEKVLDDVVEKQNSNRLVLGEQWKRRVSGVAYIFTVESCSYGKTVEISVHRL